MVPPPSEPTVKVEMNQEEKNKRDLEKAQEVIREKDAVIKYQAGQIAKLTIQLDSMKKAMEQISQRNAQNVAVPELYEITDEESDPEVELLAIIRPDRVHETIDLTCIEPEKENEPDINLQDVDGETAFHRAVMQRDEAAVRDLILAWEYPNMWRF